MKFTITADIDWLGEEDNLDNELKNRVVEEIVKTVSGGLMKEMREKSKERLLSIIDEYSNKTLDSFMNETITVTDKWGDKKESGKIRDIIKIKFDEFWSQKVDSQGRGSSSYGSGQTRLEWLVDNRIKKQCEKFSQDLAKEINKQVTSVMTDSLKVAVGSELIDRIGVPNIVKKLKS
jgi:hypothetical protein